MRSICFDNIKVLVGKGKQKRQILNIDKPVEVIEGDVVGIIGENGSGKSTLINCLLNEIPYKGEIKSEQNFINFKVPNTILGLIPLGARTSKLPVNQIASVSTNKQLKFGKLIVGVLATWVGLGMFGSSFIAGLILTFIGVNVAIDAFEIDLIVAINAGQEKVIDFYIFDKSKAELAVEQINSMISNRMDDTNTRVHADRIVDAIKAS